MRALRDIQSDFAGAILSGAATACAADVRSPGLSPDRRIQIYRNHFVITLTDSLGITFPVLRALVGEAFFAQTARRFIAEQPPASPVLFEYGEAFPQFLADQTRASEFAYLADVGALEWAINHAYHADDKVPLDTTALRHVPARRHAEIVLAFHPSVRLLGSAFPVLDIWRAHQPGAADAAVDLSSGGVRVLVWRNGTDVVWQVLTHASEAFVQVLLDTEPLANACAAALAVDPSFDAGAALNDLFAGGVVTGVRVPYLTDSTKGFPMQSPAATISHSASPVGLVRTTFDLLALVPESVLLLMARFGIGAVFFKSGLVKIASWTATVQLFAFEYQVPLLPPDLAARLAATVELTAPVLLFLGFGARIAAAAMLGMTLVIQIFVYPANWAEHLTWATLLLFVISRGPGVLSLDSLIARRFFGESR